MYMYLLTKNIILIFPSSPSWYKPYTDNIQINPVYNRFLPILWSTDNVWRLCFTAAQS